MTRRKLIVGNWKMNGGLTANQNLLAALSEKIGMPPCDAAVCVPSPYLAQVQSLLQTQSKIAWGAQDVSEHDNGAFTGDISTTMLRDFGVHYVIVGHSERRRYQNESDLTVARKARQALAAKITPIICVGETLSEREDGLTEFVVGRQLDAALFINRAAADKIVVAYEPVWAIGTGKTATPEQAQQVHAFLRQKLRDFIGAAADKVRILYGGSMKADNAAELLKQSEIDGGLIGGAALKADDFLKIIHAAKAA